MGPGLCTVQVCSHHAPSNPEGYGTIQEQCRRARLFCDAYGVVDRSQFIQTIKSRIAAMAEDLRQGAAKGDQRMQANIDEGHLEIYTTDHAYLDFHKEQFLTALTYGGQSFGVEP